jgi:hypothetical protein
MRLGRRTPQPVTPAVPPSAPLPTVESDVPSDVNGLLSNIDETLDELWRLKARNETKAFDAAAARLAALAQSLRGAELSPTPARSFFNGAQDGRTAARLGGEQ